MTKAEQTFEKIASYLDLSDVEDRVGVYANDDYEPMIRGAIAKERDNSFALRHPVLTGIPTLGIAPAIAKENALDNITRHMARRDMGIANLLKAKEDRNEARALKQQELAIKRDEANRYRNAVQAGAKALLARKIQQAQMQDQ